MDNLEEVSRPDGIIRHTLKTTNGLECEVSNYGCRILRLLVPDRDGEFEDIVLGFDSIDEYFQKPETFFGSIIGRVANRIKGAAFTLNGKAYELPANDGDNHIHGGPEGYHSIVWNVLTANDSFISFTYNSKDGEQGYPGNLKLKVTYGLTDDNGLTIQYHATTDKATPINLTNHSYFNLRGAGNENINGHIIKINASKYLPVDSEHIPVKEPITVKDSVFDLRKPIAIGDILDQESDQLKTGAGFDHTLIPDKKGLRIIANVLEPDSGRTMEVMTDEPGVQFFCGKPMDKPLTGKDGKIYGERSAFCLEAQHFPDTVNRSGFPSVILKPGQIFRSTCIYRFGVDF
ncbi:MAG: aldose 1-epimerase [Cryomorphaceae bacterium]|jgi:aldose 1-epimerase